MPKPSYCANEYFQRPDPCVLVLFGATGDLTRRKLIPALFSLFLQKLLPHQAAIVAFARKPKTDDEFREDLLDAVRAFAPSLPAGGPEWQNFIRNVYYHRSTLDDAAGYQALNQRLVELDARHGTNGNRLFYLAVPPDSFSVIADQLAACGMNKPVRDGACVRIVVEKPFGFDLASARELNRRLRMHFAEDQIYRIDHYLGKETVQNILVLRFANRLFELLWNHLYVDHVQITVAETLGMEGRGAYFDKAGVLRDMIQNHALQILTLIAMEPPVSLEADAIRDEKVKVLRSIRPFTPADVAQGTVRAQYTSAESDGKSVPGYLEEEGVPAGSTTETFAAVRLWVDNWRWAGVPFYVRSGKRLNDRFTKVVVQLREVPDVLFSRLACAEVEPNTLSICIQPNEGVEIRMSAKEPGPAMLVSPVRMHFDYAEAFGKAIPDAYERLLLNALLGDASLFARGDEVEAAWSLITPILETWATGEPPLETYPAGSRGPAGADALLGPAGRKWL